MRAVLVVFVAATVLFVPPEHDQVTCAAVAVGYTLAALGVAVWARDGGRRRRAVGVAGAVPRPRRAHLAHPAHRDRDSAELDGVRADDRLPARSRCWPRRRCARGCARPWSSPPCSSTSPPASRRRARTRSRGRRCCCARSSWPGVGAACVALSWIQRSRVTTIGRLVAARTELLAELTDLERRERRELSEQLHDGALQYVLAARQDLDEARDTGAPEAFDRLEQALLESSRLLRSTVAELHPAVLERAGLPAAVRDLVASAAARGGFAATLDLDGWPADRRTPVDGLLYRTARELLGNVVKHAAGHARRGRLSRCVDGHARLTVTDDGVGVATARRRAPARRGTHRAGVARAARGGGGRRAHPRARARSTGTVATVELPLAGAAPAARPQPGRSLDEPLRKHLRLRRSRLSPTGGDPAERRRHGRGLVVLVHHAGFDDRRAAARVRQHDRGRRARRCRTDPARRAARPAPTTWPGCGPRRTWSSRPCSSGSSRCVVFGLEPLDGRGGVRGRQRPRRDVPRRAHLVGAPHRARADRR